MFEQTFKNIDDTLWKDAGCSSELDYVEQTSWILSLKYLDDREKDKEAAARLSSKSYSSIIADEYKQSGYNLREIINLVDELRFRSQKEKHEMSHLYEGKIQNMGNAGRNGGLSLRVF
jgi:hypothetical protein